MIAEQLTIEFLAKAIHEDEITALQSNGKLFTKINADAIGLCSWTNLPDEWKEVRRHQARLMFQRIMR